ncbi:hypothetical protein R9X47_23485 [Wukongibacter baidiensis]|uniref:hypothetical protein n=1 Tax=Wukongibacter baidiensis TaxID=1723361 RepID=UPI003D7FBD24
MRTEDSKIFSPEELYEKKVHTIGRVTILTGMVLSLFVPVLLWIYYGVFPPIGNLLKGILTVSSFMIPLSIAEILSFYPILGSSGIYMAYTTGNIANLKLPSAAIGMEVADVKPSTKEGEVISSIAMAGSVIMCELILVLGVVLLGPISAKLNNPMLKPAFQHILPALFGSIGAYYILKDWKLAVVPMIIGILFSAFNIPTSVAVPVCVLCSIYAAKFLYKRGKLSL